MTTPGSGGAAVDAAAVVAALEAELAAASEPVRLTVKARESSGGGVWAFGVEVGRDEARFDESLEAARAYWPGGGGDVTAVVTDPPSVHLRFVTSDPPPVGDYLWLYPPRFLEPLVRVWQRDDAGPAAAAVLDACAGAVAGGRAPAPPPGGLRARQREAFGLLGHAASFLDGPPGTGKTHTLAALVGAALDDDIVGRVLLVSTTNAAVDLALVRADDLAGGSRRHRFVRSGYHYAPERYLGREHLLPAGAGELLAALAAVHARKPARADAAAFAAWRADEAAARRRLRAHAAEARRGARLVAMTVANAVALFDELAAGPFDLVVFDEASQIGRAAALAVARLGRRALFAGDPRQLGPVVVADHAGARRWLGTSMFLHRVRGAPNACFLDEQSRMAPPICRLVSATFYDGALRVAAESERDGGWRAARRIGRAGFEHVLVREVEPGGGRVRASSARAAASLAAGLAGEGFAPADILFLTPFRRQREALRAALDAAGFAGVEASTVHRAQGREAPAVVFDPVDEASDFLDGEHGRRLVAVALSRAQAKLVLLVAPARLADAHLFRALVDAARRPPGAGDGAAPFRLPDLAPLVAAGASLLGARLSLGAGRSCEVIAWDAAARRGEALDTTGRRIALVSPAPPPAPPAAAGGDWLDRFLARSFGPGFDAGPRADGAAARVARVHAAASASRLDRVRGLRGELDLALALAARGRRVLDVGGRARRLDGGDVDVDLVTAEGSAVAFVPAASPARPADVAEAAELARAVARGALAQAGRRLVAAHAYCAAGFDDGARALLRANGAAPASTAEGLDAIR
ncbi:MAG TPA: ATP-binding protein [Polyangiaceae bacterium]|nr:ATP-binding protein [Polyangiaceae bacterium]